MPPDQVPELIPFEPPGASDGPTKAADCNWVGWRMADERANRLEADNRQLQDEIRTLDTKREALAERVQSLEVHQRLIRVLSTIMLTLAAILAGISITIALSDKSDHKIAIVLGTLAFILVVAGACMEWIPAGNRKSARGR